MEEARIFCAAPPALSVADRIVHRRSPEADPPVDFQVDITAGALTELEEILAYSWANFPATAERFGHAILDHVEMAPVAHFEDASGIQSGVKFEYAPAFSRS